MATAARKDLPNHTAPNWGSRVTEELRVLMGRAGNGRALTASDLITAGIAKQSPGGGLAPGSTESAAEFEKDLTPPPTPTGFKANAAFSNIVVEHAAALYTQGHGHGMTVLYGVLLSEVGPLPTFDKAVELMRFGGTVASYGTNPATKWRLWIKWLTADGVLSTEPAGGINGLAVETGQDVAMLLDLLAGKVGPETLTPDVVAELGKISDLAADISGLQLQLADIQGSEEYDPHREGYPEGALVTWNGRLYRARKDVPAGVTPSNDQYWQYVGDFASLGDAVAAHSIQLQNIELEVDGLGKAASASASSVSEMSARLRDIDDDAHLADVLNQWDAHAQIKEERV
ncbi:MAG: hypothetical protein LBJ15_16295, partial [Comamonas sp.]|uniref:hypothetical protein n=1 Tax=Comamonas sp. TaxID=34028 RepID=UPI00281FBF70